MTVPVISPAPEVVVIGAGVIGLSISIELAGRGVATVLIGESRRGEASGAAAGMLAPSVERLAPLVRDFAVLARDRYPGWLARLQEASGVSVPLDRAGILEVTREGTRAARLRERSAAGEGEWLDAGAVAALEPALAGTDGGLLHRDDGAVDNVALLEALEIAVGREPGIRRIAAPAVRLDASADPVRVTAGAERLESRFVVIAAGAWSSRLEGLPRALPVEPLRGQILVLEGTPVRHVVYGDGGYLVPRGGDRTLVGATMERVGYDASTTDEAIGTLHETAKRICPSLGNARRVRAWAGLRPATPDLLPIIGAEPLRPALLYACGHSRNGILMAPLTAECIAALVTGSEPPARLGPFSPVRFVGGAAGGAASA